MANPKNIKPLGTIAQSVSNAAETAQYRYWETSDKCTKDENWALEYEMIAAAVLRAAADQLVLDPETNSQGGMLLSCKDQLCDIANELEGHP